ncbi:hypothetical protein OD91_2634 [Lutibacter sp. Hel_I_33_5]|uniref:hypothetical protein n=1 Tax=Lutibacter sp. Hel_I_33_5 TaxID=1566289 RepID=UPI00119FFA6C|nr:hypothetical protein [Lutibacter sp. Hel_I_33_5]TVZ57314.1 hypothetical protein OD91_2634 [Lutibacter sp. Hel_I_33_5]
MKFLKSYVVIFLIFFICSNFYCQKKNIKITTKRNADNSVDFYFKKLKPGSYFVNVKFSQLLNTHDGNYKGVVKDKSGFLFNLKPINKKKFVRYSFKYSWIRGNPKAKVDSLFTYVLPFEKEHLIAVKEQGYIREKFFGAERPNNWKSYALANKTTDIVKSMRRGVVVDIINKYELDTIKKIYSSKKNQLTIEHPDGTYATYKGFSKNSFLVKLGQNVYPHSPLGKITKNEKGFYIMSFYIRYLIGDNFGKKQKFINKKSRSNFISPFFLVANEKVKLKSKQKYIVDYNESVFLKEFSKKEKRKYKKKPNLFK